MPASGFFSCLRLMPEFWFFSCLKLTPACPRPPTLVIEDCFSPFALASPAGVLATLAFLVVFRVLIKLFFWIDMLVALLAEFLLLNFLSPADVSSYCR